MRRGLTMIEPLFVIAVVSVLAATLLLVLDGVSDRRVLICPSGPNTSRSPGRNTFDEGELPDRRYRGENSRRAS